MSSLKSLNYYWLSFFYFNIVHLLWTNNNKEHLGLACAHNTFTGIVVLDVRRNSEFIQELWPVVGGIQFEEFREGHGATEVEVRDVHGAEKCQDYTNTQGTAHTAQVLG